MTRWITCREFVEFLDDYLSHALAPDRVAEFEYHLSGCPPCVTYLKSYAETVRLEKRALEPDDQDVPEQVPEALVRAILATRDRS